MENPNSTHPLFIPHVLEEICNFLPFKDLKVARMVNHLWYQAATSAWRRKTQITIVDIDHLRDLLTISLQLKRVLPYTCGNWILRGETVTKICASENFDVRDNMQPFWPTVKSLTLPWQQRKIPCWDIVHPDPARPLYREKRKMYYWVDNCTSSSYAIKDIFNFCINLTQFSIEFRLLTTMKGKNIGPRQFPRLEKLTNLKIFYDGTKWINDDYENERELLEQNLMRAEPQVQPPKGKSGGNTLIIRLLENSPRLTSIKITSGTSMSSRMESWFTRHLLGPTVNLPRLADYRCWTLLEADICKGLQARTWGLKSLHLKTHPGTTISAQILHDLIASFRRTLQHLELIFIGEPATGEHSGYLFNGDQLCNLETLEMWGYKGDYSFLMDLPKLRSAVIGVTDASYYITLWKVFMDIQLPRVNLELKSEWDFAMRLNEGPRTP